MTDENWSEWHLLHLGLVSALDPSAISAWGRHCYAHWILCWTSQDLPALAPHQKAVFSRRKSTQAPDEVARFSARSTTSQSQTSLWPSKCPRVFSTFSWCQYGVRCTGILSLNLAWGIFVHLHCWYSKAPKAFCTEAHAAWKMSGVPPRTSRGFCTIWKEVDLSKNWPFWPGHWLDLVKNWLFLLKIC